jgi:hypothetical protein
MEQYRKNAAVEAGDQLSPAELADLEHDALLDKKEEEGDPTEFTESESGRILSDAQLKEFRELDEKDKALGTRWSFSKPLNDLAKQYHGMVHEEAILHATEDFTRMWKEILGAVQRGEEPDFTEFQKRGGSDESVMILKTIADDLTRGEPDVSAAA